MLWWLLLHVLLLAVVLAVVPGPAAQLLAASVTLAHALWRRPRATRLLLRGRDRRWSVPADGGRGLLLAPGSCCTAIWIRLVLTGGRTRRVIVLLRDQFEPAVWRALQAVLRREA